MSDPNDPLLNDRLLDTIITFCILTNRPNVTLVALTPYVTKMNESAILGLLFADPNNKEALGCLTNYISRKPEIPSNFRAKFLSLCKMTVTLQSTVFGSSTSSITGTVRSDSVIPTLPITEASAKSIVSYLSKSNANKYTATFDKSRLFAAPVALTDDAIVIIAQATLHYDSTSAQCAVDLGRDYKPVQTQAKM